MKQAKRMIWVILVLVLFMILKGIEGIYDNSKTSSESLFDDSEEVDVVHEPFSFEAINVGDFFKESEGTFILSEIGQNNLLIYNHQRANQRFAPQSTFKIPNALIGLQVGAVENEEHMKEWDGVLREIDAWNQDHSLKTGFENSVVWYYQEMARDIGEEKMNEWLSKISYGNQDSSEGIDQFWLSSSLEISPVEQSVFLEKLVQEDLPFDHEVMQTVKNMMKLIEEEDYTVYAKTGQGSGIGWFVGYVEREDMKFVFVTNLEGTSVEARDITIEILKRIWTG
ncbi:class D beta-lactamase [Halalkalibacter okhensis]|uniref:Beta-lactamase n=1 Tax=Halalkalibacter okhensis TaxID=333138 RepID=A0A0B0IPN1_9BACI|nr:class D beta-lactamase [Halalkalibacter okhensis]KHF41636.1 beta-lactamase [Halalkalibacter okhensis]